MCHRIPTPWWGRELRDPRFSGAGHGTSRTDSGLSVVVVLLRSEGCREFLLNQFCWCHQARSFQ
jgi:hypothetical protein